STPTIPRSAASNCRCCRQPRSASKRKRPMARPQIRSKPSERGRHEAMAVADTQVALPAAGERWFGLPEEEVARRLGVDPAVGLSAARASELLSSVGPNELPAERPLPGWRRFLTQYRAYMQLILLGAAIVSLAIEQWSTGAMLIVITVVNATVGLRQEGKA